MNSQEEVMQRQFEMLSLVKKVKEHRADLNLNQPQAAICIGISVYTLRQFEMGGEVSSHTLNKILAWLEKGVLR